MSIITRAAASLAVLVVADALCAQDATPSPLTALRDGDYAKARSELVMIVANRPDAALHIAYLEGLIKVQQGEFEAAASTFRSILSVAPDYEPARRELTFALAHLGETAGALYHAERLVAQTSDERLRAGLQALINNTSQGNPRGVGLQFAILPSTNASKGTDDEVIVIGGLPFVIDEASRAQDGVGLSFGISAWNRWVLSENWSATLSGTLSAQVYKEARANEQTGTVKLDFHRPFTQGRVNIGPVADLTFTDGDKSRERIGVAGSGVYALAPGREMSAGLTHWWQTYPDREFRDGTSIVGFLGYRQSLSPSTSLSLSLPFNRERTDLAHLDHDDIGVVVGLDREWSNGLISGFSAGLRRDNYLGDFPGSDEPLEDIVSTLGVSLLHRNLTIGRYAPLFSYTYTNSSSNIGFFDYDSHDVAITLSTRF
ncbi:MAG: DUF560 domain-containing protein [Loktanella sp.]|nr:DUF560 domain-containing protein [Loktanella sp.]